MREPKSWRDRGLLEDEPFLSAFKARQLAAPPTRRGAGPTDEDDDARNNAIVNEIVEMKLFDSVQAWLDFAFKPHYDFLNVWRKVKVEDPGMICLFVRFYWALSHSFSDATKILHAARKERGWTYFVDNNDTLDFTADLTKQVHPDQTSQIGDNAFQSLSKNVPCDIEFQKNLNPKEDMPDCPEREEKSSSQTCPPSLDPTSLSVTFQNEFDPSSTLPLPPDSRNTTAICDLPKKKRKGRQMSRDEHRKFNEATSDTNMLCNVSQTGNGVNDEKAKAQPSQSEDISVKADVVSNAALCAQPPLEKELGGISRGLKFNKNLSAKEVVPDCPEREGKDSSQTCPPSLDPTSLSVTPQNGPDPSSTLPIPPDSLNTTAICDLPKKKRKGRQMSPDRPRKKHRKVNKVSSDTNKLRNVPQTRSDVIDEKAKAQPSQSEDISDKVDDVSNSALCAQPPLKKVPGKIPRGLKFNKNLSTKKVVPDCPEREAKDSSQTCPPSLDPTSLSVTREIIEFHPSTLSLPPDSQNTSDLPKPRKRQTSPDTPHKKHRGISEATLDASELGGNNNLEPPPKICHIVRKKEKLSIVCKPVASSRSELTRTELDETVLSSPSNASVPKIHDPQRGVEAHPAQGKQKSRSTSQATKKTSVLAPQPNDSTCQPKQYETTSNPKKRRASNSEGHQRKRHEVPVDQEDSVPTIDQPKLVKKRGRPPNVKKGQEGSASLTVQPIPRKKMDRPPKSEVQLNTATVAPFLGHNVDTTRETPLTSFFHFPPAQAPHAVSGLQETVEGFLRHDHVPRSILDGGIKEEINPSENWVRTQEHVLVEDFILDCEAPAATQIEDRPTDIFPTQKPPLSVNPPIWAQSRQEVCETFDWFRSYQGGVYFAHNTVKGYLLSAFSSKRDRFEHDGKLIISHGGGKSESVHTRKGQTTTQPATDQLAQDKSVRALLDNYRNQRPLALIIDDKYALFPYDLGVKDMTYVVLGFYTIAHAWAEFQPTASGDHVVRYKFAFRWCDDQGSPWWLTDKETNFSDLPPPSIPSSFSIEPTSKGKPRKLLNNRDAISKEQSENGEGAVLHTTVVREAVSQGPMSSECILCHMDSPRVYTWAWLCLHPDCSGFWKDINGNFAPDNLEYDLNFLKLMTSFPVPPDYGKLKPDPPPRLSTDGTVTSYAFTRGFHCNSCGRLSCRVKWEKWECSNCKEYLPVSRPPHQAKDFWSNMLPIGYKDHFISTKSKIEQQPVRSFRHENGMGSIQSFILPDGRGKIHHIQPGTPLGRVEADDIFIEYQEQATAGELKFRRWPLRSHKCRGALLTNYFSQNCGEPYQYVGGTANTVPFENAPGAVVKARALIQKRVQQALEMHVEFNEILSAAYMERQKMAFHSDNEIGLGPVVAGLSLGSPALMHFRINAKHDRLRELKGNLMSFVLRHGDILVMDGASVQEYYEHTVIPNNFRIAATARHITPGHATA